MRIDYSIVFVSDMARSVAFYRDLLGIPLRFESPEWTELATEGATLALHATDEPAPGGGEDAGNPAGSARPGLAVPDLDGLHERLVAAGVRCVQEPTELHGARLAQYLDPDGLRVSLSQDRARG